MSKLSQHDPFYTGPLFNPAGDYVFTGEMKQWNGRWRNSTRFHFESPITADDTYTMEVTVGKDYYIEMSGTINGTVTLETDSGSVIKDFSGGSAGYAYTATTDKMHIVVTGSSSPNIVVSQGHTV